MSAARILVVQPDASVPIGALGEWLSETDAVLETRCMPDDDLPEELDDYDALLCLGGAMNAEDDTAHPWLRPLRALLGRAVSADLPTLGICLGGQLLSAAMGGRVVPATEGREVGPALVAKKDAAWVDPLFSELPLMQDVFQFHGDVIERLPARAELLASSPRAPHQAFRLRRHVYGVQFHIETTPEIARAWAEKHTELASAARPGAFDEDTLAQVHDDIAQTWRPFAHRFVELATGRLDPVEERYTLPLA